MTSGALPVHNWFNHRYRRDLVDLHNGEFCVDVSTYTDVQYRPEPREKCDTTFAKQCEDKTEEVTCIISTYTWIRIGEQFSLKLDMEDAF